MAPSENQPRTRILWVTDFDYPARGRDYGAEDRWLISRLEGDFDITTVHPRDAVAAMTDDIDSVVVRNSGPVTGYAREYEAFRERARDGVRVYNELAGKADMLGKRYLLDMHEAGMPVIPTVRPGAFEELPSSDAYVVKPIDGADSDGLRFVDAREVATVVDPDVLVQPRIDMRAEISFVFVDRTFQYAVSTSPGGARWQVVEYVATEGDVAFAQVFIDWNDIEHGIQRVDACRDADGRLLLVELEDLNPYLSLDVLTERTRERFVLAFKESLHRSMQA